MRVLKTVNAVLGSVGRHVRRHSTKAITDPSQRSVACGLSASEHNSLDNVDSIYADPNLIDHYFTPERLAFYPKLAGWMKGLGINNPISVIDVGCGGGHLLAEASRHYPKATLLGVDWSAAAVRVATKLHPQFEFRVADIFELSALAEQFDLVLTTEVLEHLEEPVRAAECLLQVCSPGGAVVVTVPDGRKDTFGGHVNFWTPESFEREFRGLAPQIETNEDSIFAVLYKPEVEDKRTT